MASHLFGKRTFRSIFVLTLALVLLQSCSIVQNLFSPKVKFPTSQVEVKFNSEISSFMNQSSAKVISLAESKPFNHSETIKIPQSPEGLFNVVAVYIEDKIKLLDFVIPEVNSQPNFSFRSTARSLVFSNPLFLSLPLDKRVSIFQAIDKDKQIDDLSKLVAASDSLLDEQLAKLSTDIAFRVAEKQGVISNVLPSKSPSPQSSSVKSKTSSSMATNKGDLPQATCGDLLPTDPSAYPLDIYPVHIEDIGNNLQIAKSKFCADALQLTREETGKKSIQLGSFTSMERANSFKNKLKSDFNSAEVGKPTRVDKKSSSIQNPVSQLSELVISGVNAQSPPTNLEFKVTEQFESDNSKLNLLGVDLVKSNYPLWHGVTLTAIPNGVKFTGTTPLAQQIIVVPKDKVKAKGLTNNDYGGEKKLDADVVGEVLIEPAELGIWNGSVVETLAGGNKFEKVLTSVKNGSWQPGEYIAILSAGSKLSRSNSAAGQQLSAYHLNLGYTALDLLNLLGLSIALIGSGKNRVEMASNIGSVLYDCVLSTFKEESIAGITSAIGECIVKPDNSTKMAEVLGIENKEIIEKMLSSLFRLEGETWRKFSKNIAKAGALSINVLDKTISYARTYAFDQYLAREGLEGLYVARFSVVDPAVEAMAPKNVEVVCSSKAKKELLDMEITMGDGVFCNGIMVKNYSNYPVEIVSRNPNRTDVDKSLDSFLVHPNNVVSEGQFLSPFARLWQIETGRATLGSSYKYPLTVRRIGTNLPEKEITFNCSDTELPITWGLKITPKCLESGTYAEYTNYAVHPLELTIGNDVVTLRGKKSDGLFPGGEGTLRSSSKTVTIKIKANLNVKPTRVLQ